MELQLHQEDTAVIWISGIPVQKGPLAMPVVSYGCQTQDQGWWRGWLPSRTHLGLYHWLPFYNQCISSASSSHSNLKVLYGYCQFLYWREPGRWHCRPPGVQHRVCIEEPLVHRLRVSSMV